MQQAGDLARMRHLGSATPRGEVAKGGGVIEVETGIDDKIIKELVKRGHVVRRSVGGFGGYQGIFIDHQNGVLRGASEPRKDGIAVGY